MKLKPWQLVALLVVSVLVLGAGFYGVTQWQRTRPGEPIREVEIKISSGDNSTQIKPYTVCELDAECDGGQPPSLQLDPSGDVTVDIPRDVSRSSWRLLSIYDDPAANDEQLFQSGEASKGSVPATKDGAHLVVAEVSALAIDTDDNGEETPVLATWSVSFEQS